MKVIKEAYLNYTFIQGCINVRTRQLQVTVMSTNLIFIFTAKRGRKYNARARVALWCWTKLNKINSNEPFFNCESDQFNSAFYHFSPFYVGSPDFWFRAVRIYVTKIHKGLLTHRGVITWKCFHCDSTL